MTCVVQDVVSSIPGIPVDLDFSLVADGRLRVERFRNHDDA